MAGKRKSSKDEPSKRRRQNEQVADWAAASPELLQAVIANATQGDGAIRFGYSRDGGAYSVGVYGDGEPFTEYLPGSGDVDEWLEGFRLDYE
jgi:hypothetical protein